MKFYLDFGHGGKDSGAVGFNGTYESNVVLKIGLILVRLGLGGLLVKRVKPLVYIQRFYLYFRFALKIQG